MLFLSTIASLHIISLHRDGECSYYVIITYHRDSTCSPAKTSTIEQTIRKHNKRGKKTNFSQAENLPQLCFFLWMTTTESGMILIIRASLSPFPSPVGNYKQYKTSSFPLLRLSSPALNYIFFTSSLLRTKPHTQVGVSTAL